MKPIPVMPKSWWTRWVSARHLSWSHQVRALTTRSSTMMSRSLRKEVPNIARWWREPTLSQDRLDNQYSVKERSKDMSAPKTSSWEKLKRLCRYIKGRPMYVIKFRYQANVHAVNAICDSDWAKDPITRTSTSGGLIAIGDHVIKSWSTTQSVVAMSTGEADCYALTKCAAMALGAQSLLADLGVHLSVRVTTDATTGKAIASRRGLGKVRHIETHELWMQDVVDRKRIELHKIKSSFNPADIFTKYLSREEMDIIVDRLDHAYEAGRSDVAP